MSNYTAGSPSEKLKNTQKRHIYIDISKSLKSSYIFTTQMCGPSDQDVINFCYPISLISYV